MSRAASADAVGARPHRSACGSRGGEVRPRVSIGDAEGHLRRGARARARTSCVALRAANTCATVERPLLHATSSGTSASSSRRSRHEGAGRSVLAVVPWRSRCADGSSSTASRSRSRPRREGSALPAFQERSSSKGLRPTNSSRCSMRTRRRRGPSMRCMPAAVASHPLRERSSRSRRGIWSALAGRQLRLRIDGDTSARRLKATISCLA